MSDRQWMHQLAQALGLHESDIDIIARYYSAEAARVQELLWAAQRADSHLSLLRHRCEKTIPWGMPGIPEIRDVDAVIGELRKALGAWEK